MLIFKMAYFHCQYPIQIFKNPKLLIRGKLTFFTILNCTFPPRTVTVIVSCAHLLAGQERNRESRNTIHDHAMPSSSEELGQRWREMWLTLWVHLHTRRGVLQPACIDSPKPVVPTSSQFHAQWCHEVADLKSAMGTVVTLQKLTNATKQRLFVLGKADC